MVREVVMTQWTFFHRMLIASADQCFKCMEAQACRQQTATVDPAHNR